MYLDEINSVITASKNYYARLVILVGAHASQALRETAKSHGSSPLNLGLVLSTRLLEVPMNDRPKLAPSFFEQILNGDENEIIFLGHLEVLFDRSIGIDPLKLLKNCAKNVTLVVVWPGNKLANSLSYATPNHPEYRLYKDSETKEIAILDVDGTYKEPK